MSCSLTFRLETKMPWRQTPSRKKKDVVFTNVTKNAYQDQLNAGFSKVCEIFKVCGIESLKYVREFYTPVCYCGDISTPRNVTLNETNCDWLFDMSVGRPWPMKAAIYSRPSAVSLKFWLRKTKYRVQFSLLTSCLLACLLLTYWLFISTYKAHILHDHILHP